MKDPVKRQAKIIAKRRVKMILEIKDNFVRFRQMMVICFFLMFSSIIFDIEKTITIKMLCAFAYSWTISFVVEKIVLLMTGEKFYINKTSKEDNDPIPRDLIDGMEEGYAVNIKIHFEANGLKVDWDQINYIIVNSPLDMKDINILVVNIWPKIFVKHIYEITSLACSNKNIREIISIINKQYEGN